MNGHKGWTVTDQKHFLINIFTSLKNLKTFIKYLLNLLVSSVVKLSIFNLSSHPISDKPEVNFVAVFVPFPKHLYPF